MALNIALKAVVELAAFDGFGQQNPVRKVRNWKTEAVEFDSGVRQALSVLDQPVREWFINWSLLDEGGQDAVRRVFDAARGRGETFLWLDDKEYLCSGEEITTDGAETQYQLVCTYHGGESYEWTETKTDIVAGSIYPPTVTHSVDGAQTEVQVNPPTDANTFYLDDTTGIMVWPEAHPPSAGVLTVTFEYYFRVWFAEDSWEDIQGYPGPLYAGSELHIVECFCTFEPPTFLIEMAE